MKNFSVKTLATISITVGMLALSATASAYSVCSYGNPNDDTHRLGSGETQKEALQSLYNECYREFSRGTWAVQAYGKTYCSGMIRFSKCISDQLKDEGSVSSFNLPL